MKKKIIALVSFSLLIVSLMGCSEQKSQSSNALPVETVSTQETLGGNTQETSCQYKDGTYEAETEPDHEGYITKGTLTIKEGIITEVDWGIFDSNMNNKPFDEDYEEVFVGNDLYIEQSRSDWTGSRCYSPKLIETQDPKKVDAVTGATWTNIKFIEIMKMALEKAKN